MTFSKRSTAPHALYSPHVHEEHKEPSVIWRQRVIPHREIKSILRNRVNSFSGQLCMGKHHRRRHQKLLTYPWYEKIIFFIKIVLLKVCCFSNMCQKVNLIVWSCLPADHNLAENSVAMARECGIISNIRGHHKFRSIYFTHGICR